MEVERLAPVGTTLGLTGTELREWVEEERLKLRDERARAREEKEQDRELAERSTAFQVARQQALQKEQEVIHLRHEATESGDGPTSDPTVTGDRLSSHMERSSPHKLMPAFNEERDDLDAYLKRFERAAPGLGWPAGKWALSLSLCLTGEALTVVSRMSTQDAQEYEKLTLALRKRFRYTSEGYREVFRGSRPEGGQTGQQFAGSLTSYFDRWLYLSGIEKTYESIRDKI